MSRRSPARVPLSVGVLLLAGALLSVAAQVTTTPLLFALAIVCGVVALVLSRKGQSR